MTVTLYLPTAAATTFQAFSSAITINPGLVKNLVPTSALCQSIRSANYVTLADYNFEYTFVWKFNIEDYINNTLESVGNAFPISHDQIRLNFNTSLTKSNGQVIQLKELLNSTQYSNQLNTSGITLGEYANGLRNGITVVGSQNPIDVTKINVNQPYYYNATFPILTVSGSVVQKTAIFGVMTFMNNSNQKQVLLWGIGIQDIVV